MSWTVSYAPDARQDLKKLYRYICDVLQEPNTAKKQIRHLRDSANSLNHLPFRYRIHDEEPWRTLGYRVFPVGNFLIFYLPDETKETVTISRFIYGARDIATQLEQS